MRAKNSKPAKSNAASFIVSIEMFNYAWLVVANCEWDEAQKIIAKKAHVTGLLPSDQPFHCCWWARKSDTVDGIIYLPTFENTPLRVSNLVHELCHAVTDMCEYVGVPMDVHADETLAYALGYLTRACLTALT